MAHSTVTLVLAGLLLASDAHAARTGVHPRAKLPYSMLTAPHARARHRRVIDSWKPIRSSAGDPTIRPTDFGADPTGQSDSTSAFQQAVAELLAHNASGHHLAFGVADLGGATIDLEGGDYLISAPLAVPVNYGNFRIIDGTLRATQQFNSSRFLIEIGDGTCSNGQGSCNENAGLEGLMLDASQVAAGGILITATMGAVIGPQMFVFNFTTAGIQLDGGHEAMISDTWLGEFAYSDPRKENGTASVAVGIQINGNDHYVTNTIVFSSHIGVVIAGSADVLTGVHTWNLAASNGGTGIRVLASQNRLEEVYLDYNTLEIQDPYLVTVINSFFLCCAQLVLTPNKGGVITGLYIAGNEFNNRDNLPAIAIGTGGANFTGAKDVTISGNMVAPGVTVPNTVVTRSVTSTSTTTQFSIDFSDALLLPPSSAPIQTVTYSVMWDAGQFTSSSARAPMGGVVVVETSSPVSGTVTITVDQGTTTS